MKKFATFILFLAALSVYGQSKGIVSLDEATRQAGIYVKGVFPAGHKVAIINIESESTQISSYIINELTVLLVNESALTVVGRDPKDLELIRQEEQYQLSGEVSDDTAQRIGHKIGAQTIISGSFVRLGSQYQLRIRALGVETAQVQGVEVYQVKSDKVLRGLEKDSGVSSGSLWDGLYDKNWLYLGVRAGLSLGFYENGGGLVDISIYPSISLKGNPGFTGALYASVSIWSLFAIQAEAVFTSDSFKLLSGNTTLMTVSYYSLMIPLLVKLVYRPSIFKIQGFAGAYLSLPLGQMEVKHSNGSYKANFPLMGGFTTGGGFGVKLGPGYVMADIRYASDFGNVTASYNGTRNVGHRSNVHFTLGYEFGMIKK